VHGSFPSFPASWAAMTATMLLTAGPAAARYAHGRVAAGLLFALSYLAVWGFAGVAVSVLCGSHGSLAPAPTVIAAGVYELTPLKRYFRQRCRESAASGLDAGFDCVGSCLGLMLAAMALGVTSAAGMTVVALLVAAQKLLPGKAAVDVPLALAIVGLGLLVVIAPSSVPALTAART
jgi:predicted metal-binding membrane protein